MRRALTPGANEDFAPSPMEQLCDNLVCPPARLLSLDFSHALSLSRSLPLSLSLSLSHSLCLQLPPSPAQSTLCGTVNSSEFILLPFPLHEQKLFCQRSLVRLNMAVSFFLFFIFTMKAVRTSRLRRRARGPKSIPSASERRWNNAKGFKSVCLKDKTSVWP